MLYLFSGNVREACLASRHGAVPPSFESSHELVPNECCGFSVKRAASNVSVELPVSTKNYDTKYKYLRSCVILYYVVINTFWPASYPSVYH